MSGLLPEGAVKPVNDREQATVFSVYKGYFNPNVCIFAE